ncbi:MAG: carbon storage regulator [Planctomycetes bacterium]|nr:carbon storage regulator [Planctomycetota bacterium]
MRVYTRGVDEGLMIGKTVQVNVLEVQTNCVRLAIIDPDASPTYREEVLYLPSESDDCDFEFDQSDSCNVFDDDFTFEDEDSRLIPMA